MKKAFVLLVALLALSAVSSRMFTKKTLQGNLMTDPFGREYLFEEGSGYTSTLIDTQRIENLFTPELMVKNVQDLTEMVKNKDAFKPKDSTIEECQPSHPDYFKFTAKTVATLKRAKQVVAYKSFCYPEVVIEMAEMGTDSVTIDITTIGKKNLFCGEGYLLSTGRHFHYMNIHLPGVHKVKFTGLKADEMTYMAEGGARVMRFCDSMIHFIPDLLKTAQLFLGGLGLNPNIPFFGSKVPMEMQKANVEFIKHATGYQWEARQNPGTFIDLDAKYVQSGDFLAITRFDGLDNIIHYGAGSHAGHSTMALWDHSENPAQLYVVESQDAWYWPTHGLQRTKWEDWKKQALNADFNVAVLPLRKEYAEKFNEQAAWEWFRRTEGMPYGYRNFLFGWIDTVAGNYPPPLEINFVYLIFRVLEYISKENADRLLQEALNWRIGTEGLDFFEVEEKALSQGKTVNDLFAMVEKEGHLYSDGYAYVCSSYVMSYYTKSGMIPFTTSATEFTPRDVYNLDIFDRNWNRPTECVNADPDLPYCQIMGNWKMVLPDYSSVKPYDHMAENCPTLPPLYLRPEGC